EGRLEQRRDDARQPGSDRAVAVEARLREEQRGDQEREPHVVLGLVKDRGGVERIARGGLEAEGGDDRKEDRREVQREQRQAARTAPQRVHPQQEGQRRRPLAAHVALGERRPRRRGQRL